MMPEWAGKLPWDLIRKSASENGLDPNLVAAICEQESHGENWKPHLDPAWKDFWFPRQFAENLGISVDTETTLQKMSWGIMQVEGAVARQHGLKGDIPELCRPELSIQYGCLHLKWLNTYRHCLCEADLICSYNLGHVGKTPGGLYPNQRYVDGVSAFLHELRAI